MEVDVNEVVKDTIKDAIKQAIVDRLRRDYNNPLDAVITKALNEESERFRELLAESLRSCSSDAAFKEELTQGLRSCLAKSLVKRFGGELEKQVNALKSDPTTRARITLAIEEIVKTAQAV